MCCALCASTCHDPEARAELTNQEEERLRLSGLEATLSRTTAPVIGPRSSVVVAASASRQRLDLSYQTGNCWGKAGNTLKVNYGDFYKTLRCL